MKQTDQAELDLAEQRSALRTTFKRILPVIFLATVICYVDRANLGYAQLGMGADLGITAATYGAVAAVFFVAYTFCEVPSNLLMKVFGARIWITRIMLTWGIVTALTGFVNNIPMLFVCRILLGVAEAGFLPGMLLYLTLWFRSRDRVIALGALFAAQPIGFIVAGAGGGLILDHVHWFGLDSWRWVFILTAVPALLMAVVVFKTLPDTPAKAAWLTPSERQWMTDEVAKERGPEVNQGFRAELAALWDTRILHLALVFLTYGVGFYGFTLFLPLIVRQINPDYSPTDIGFVSVVPYIFGTLAVIVCARLARSAALNRALTVGLLTALGLGIVGVIFFAGQPGIALFALCLAAIGTFGFTPSFWALATASIPRAKAAVGIAVITSFANVGGFIGPYLVGQVSVGDKVTIGLVAPAISVAVALVLLVAFQLRPALRPETTVAETESASVSEHL